MTDAPLKPTFKKKGEIYERLIVVEISDTFMLAVYQGKLSQYDMLVKYVQKVDGKWSRPRTPKHIHWAVDMLIKMHEDRQKTEELLDEFIKIWGSAVPLRTAEGREKFLNPSVLLAKGEEMDIKYTSLNSKGEYSVKFLTVLAILLMTQEKTNREDAYMFGKVLEVLKKGTDIFNIVSSSSYSGR